MARQRLVRIIGNRHNRLIRPRSKYTGPPRRPWQPLAAR